jgi:hypothetical protein
MKVFVLPEVRQYLDELSQILYEKNYFSFLELSEKYVEELFEDIETTIQNRPKRLAPAYFDKYGKKMFYTIFRKNKTTQWYVFFNIYETKDGLIYLIRYISNNHVVAHHF